MRRDIDGPLIGGQETVASAVRPPRARLQDQPGWDAGFQFAKDLRDLEHRQAMAAAGFAPGMRTVACEPHEPISSVLRRVEQVEGDGDVFVAVRDGDGWAMLRMPKPHRTT